MSEEKLKPLIYQKIFNVMKDIEYMEKDGEVSFNKTHYRYLSAEKIVENCRKEIIKQQLIIYPCSCITDSYEGSQKDITITYRVLAIEDGSFIDVQVTGGGHDSTDKKSYKAMTGAYKYALRQTFMIETGDNDPDKTPSKPQGRQPAPKVDDLKDPKSDKPVTEKQLKRMYAMANEAEVDFAVLDEQIKKKYKIEHKSEMSMKEIDEVFTYLEKEIKAKENGQ